jgi:hypothetical protein
VHPLIQYLLALLLIGAISGYTTFCGPTRTVEELACLEARRMVAQAREALALDATNEAAQERLHQGEAWASRDCGR